MWKPGQRECRHDWIEPEATNPVVAKVHFVHTNFHTNGNEIWNYRYQGRGNAAIRRTIESLEGHLLALRDRHAHGIDETSQPNE